MEWLAITVIIVGMYVIPIWMVIRFNTIDTGAGMLLLTWGVSIVWWIVLAASILIYIASNNTPPDCHTITIDGVAYVQADCVEIGAE